MKPVVRKSEKPRRRSAPRNNERHLVTQHPRRRILRLAAGAAALPALSRSIDHAPGAHDDIANR
jgi:hypothetical protein